MYFKDSCITKLSPFSCIEESTALPSNIFPAYIGSGNSIMSIDASGLQVLNHGVQKAFGSMPDAGDMYVVSHGMLSDRIDKMNILPYGFFSWDMDFNDLVINAENLQSEASSWTRKLFLDEGRIVTTMLINNYIKLEIEVIMPLKKNCIVMNVRIKGYDYSNRPIEPAKNGKMGLWLNMTTRNGKPIYDKGTLSNDTLSVCVNGFKEYEYDMKFTSSTNSELTFEADRLGFAFDIEAGNSIKEYSFVVDFDGVIGIKDIELLLINNVIDRKTEYEKLAKIEGLDVVEDFLYNNTHYLLMSCFNMEKGIPIGMPFYFPWCWRCSTFWDSHFVMDGMMRSNAREQADTFLKYINSILKKEGKPFSWMFAYDGTPTVEDDRDIAPLVMCAHAMTAIKHYDYFKDLDILKNYGYEICRRVSEFASVNLFGKNEEGKWILSMPVSGDVVEEAPQEINQTFTVLWFLVIFKKTLEMQKILGLKQNEHIKEIVSNYALERTQDEYLSAKDLTAREQEGASWVPFLLFPTEAMPLIDMDLMNKTRKIYNFPDLYMEKQGSYQPWTEFIQASSDFRRGAIEEGYAMRMLGLTHAFGHGLFSEIGPKQQTVGLPPYISAHGSFLTALISQFITTDIWNNEINIFSKMPIAYKGRTLKIKNVVCSNGFLVSAELNKYSVCVILENKNEQNAFITLPLPEQLDVDSIRVFVNNKQVSYDYEKSNRIIKLNLKLIKNTQIFVM